MDLLHTLGRRLRSSFEGFLFNRMEPPHDHFLKRRIDNAIVITSRRKPNRPHHILLKLEEADGRRHWMEMTWADYSSRVIPPVGTSNGRNSGWRGGAKRIFTSLWAFLTQRGRGAKS